MKVQSSLPETPPDACASPPSSLFGCGWTLIRDTVEGFIADDALSRGASIAYYTLFSIAPALLIVVAIARLAF